MNNTRTITSSRPGLMVGTLVIALLALSIIGIHTAYASINGFLELGADGQQVTELQTYLATNATIYPEGLVTGHFGPLTQAAVQRFQVAQGIVTSGTPDTTGYGRVGPKTMARINALRGGTSNQDSNVSWDTVPVLSTPTVQVTSTTAIFAWSTNEVTQGKVYWSISPIQSDEATGPRQQPFISGTLALDAGGLQSGHTVTVSNLQTNTTYYFVVRSIDAGGNMSETNLMTFRTSQF